MAPGSHGPVMSIAGCNRRTAKHGKLLHQAPPLHTGVRRLLLVCSSVFGSLVLHGPSKDVQLRCLGFKYSH